MRGLIIKDFYCFKKQLTNYAFVLMGVIVISLMFALSCRYGNIYRISQEFISGNEMTSADAAQFCSIAMLLFMLIPIASIGDVSVLFVSDAEAGFLKVSATLPVSIEKRVAARYIVTILLFILGISVDLIMSIWLSGITKIISFGQFSGVIISFTSIMMMYVSIMFLLIAVMGVNKTIYASLIPILAGVIGFIAINREYISDLMINSDVDRISELFGSIKQFIITKSYILLLIAGIVTVLSYILTVSIARRKRGVC